MRVSLSPQEFRELLLSHHPDFPCFDDDVIILFGRRICAGCLLAYPTAAVIVLVFRPTGIESIFLAFLFAALSQIRRFSKNITINHFCRLVAGIALGFGIGGGYFAVMNNQWVVVILLISAAGVYLLLKVNSVKQKLKHCKNE
jgi:hypothetical protein